MLTSIATKGDRVEKNTRTPNATPAHAGSIVAPVHATRFHCRFEGRSLTPKENRTPPLRLKALKYKWFGLLLYFRGLDIETYRRLKEDSSNRLFPKVFQRFTKIRRKEAAEVASLRGESSNQLFETLEEWNTLLRDGDGLRSSAMIHALRADLESANP